MTHFQVFGLSPAPDLDVAALEQKHRALSLELHPDRQAGKDAKARLAALEQTTRLNDAFKVLKDPVKRAVYLLKLKGVDLEREGEGRVQLPMEFLQDILERREALDEARAKKDEAKVRAMAKEIADLARQCLATAQDALRKDDLATAAAQLGRVRYFGRFLEEVDAFEEEMLS
jgi:molecular chaperone HscB